MNFLSKMFAALRVSRHWVKSLDLSSKGNYLEALEHLESIEKIMSLRAEEMLLKGYLHYSTNQDGAIDLLQSSIRMIGASEKYSKDEKNYMISYASVWASKISDKYVNDDAYPFEINYQEIDLGKVRKFIKDNYPLREHPSWIEAE